jgi:hypothetical protein
MADQKIELDPETVDALVSAAEAIDQLAKSIEPRAATEAAASERLATAVSDGFTKLTAAVSGLHRL